MQPASVLQGGEVAGGAHTHTHTHTYAPMFLSLVVNKSSFVLGMEGAWWKPVHPKGGFARHTAGRRSYS